MAATETPQAVPHQIVLTRPWEPGTHATVTWNSSEVTHGDDLLAAVQRAVTAWVKEDNAEGEFESDYNVGDLLGDLSDAQLTARLAAEGVTDLDIETASNPHSHDWEFDTRLLTE